MKTMDIPFLLRTLKDRYPDVKTQLVHQNPFQLLTATIYRPSVRTARSTR